MDISEYPFFQKLKENSKKSKNEKAIRHNRRKKKGDNGSDSKSIIMLFRVSDRRKRDVDGMVTTVMDCLVRAKTIKDDSLEQFYQRHAVGVYCEKGDEGVDILIY